MKSEELSFERQRLEREMEKLNSDIAEEEAKREEQRVRFVQGIKAQVDHGSWIIFDNLPYQNVCTE